MVCAGVSRVSAAEGSAGGSPPSGMFLSCRPQSFGSAHEQAFRHLAEWGVDRVEVPLPDPDESAALREELGRFGLSCGSLQVTFDVDDPGVADRIGEAARRALEEFGCRRLYTSVHSGPQGKQQAYDVLRRAGDAVARSGATLLIETHPDLGTNGAVAAETMAAVGHPHVRSNWDAANVFYYNENSDPVAEFETALSVIGGLHLKDTRGGFRSWDFGALGEGVVPFGYLLRRLRETGFAGPCTMEIEGIEHEQITADAEIARVKRSVDYLRRLGYFPPAR